MRWGRRGKRSGERVERLGELTTRSGDVLLIDFGLLRLWSGRAAPLLDGDLVGEEIAEAARSAQDWEIIGSDGAQAAALLDLAVVKGRYAFDVPSGSDVVAERLRGVTESSPMQAELVEIGRVPHLDRTELLLAEHPAGAEVPFHGGWAVAVRGLPVGTALPVLGRRMASDGPDAGRWHSVWIEVSPGEAASQHEAGYVLVDEARLLWADPDGLGEFRSDKAADGLADVVLWGRDAQSVAAELEAPALQDGEFGWLNVSVQRATALARQLDGVRANPGRKFAFDLRPHDDHYRLLEQIRRTQTESGVVSLGDSMATGFMTTWGDGAFPVFCDRGPGGELLRVRVELGAPEIVTRTRRFEDLWFGPMSKLALVSTRVTEERADVRWLFREAPDRDDDSGWRVFAGDETQDYCDDPSHVKLMPLRELVELDDRLEAVLRTPAPAAFERGGPGEEFFAAAPPAPLD